jgi:hypothetical protein
MGVSSLFTHAGGVPMGEGRWAMGGRKYELRISLTSIRERDPWCVPLSPSQSPFRILVTDLRSPRRFAPRDDGPAISGLGEWPARQAVPWPLDPIAPSTPRPLAPLGPSPPLPSLRAEGEAISSWQRFTVYGLRFTAPSTPWPLDPLAPRPLGPSTPAIWSYLFFFFFSSPPDEFW